MDGLGRRLADVFRLSRKRQTSLGGHPESESQADSVFKCAKPSTASTPYDGKSGALFGEMKALMNLVVDQGAAPDRQVQRGLQSSLISIASNFAFATCKCFVGFAGHSFALIADGVESLSDVFSSAVVYLGLRVALKPPDSDHPYGHGKAEPVAALFVGMGMALAAVLIAAESIALIRQAAPAAGSLHSVGSGRGRSVEDSSFAVRFQGRASDRQHRRARRCMASLQRRHHVAFCLRRYHCGADYKKCAGR